MLEVYSVALKYCDKLCMLQCAHRFTFSQFNFRRSGELTERAIGISARCYSARCVEHHYRRKEAHVSLCPDRHAAADRVEERRAAEDIKAALAWRQTYLTTRLVKARENMR